MPRLGRCVGDNRAGRYATVPAAAEAASAAPAAAASPPRQPEPEPADDIGSAPSEGMAGPERGDGWHSNFHEYARNARRRKGLASGGNESFNAPVSSCGVQRHSRTKACCSHSEGAHATFQNHAQPSSGVDDTAGPQPQSCQGVVRFVRQLGGDKNGHTKRVKQCCIFQVDVELHKILTSREGSSQVPQVSSCEGKMTMILSCADDCCLKLWDIQSGCCVRTLEGHTEVVRDCCVFSDISKENPKAVSASADTTLKVWNLCDGRCECTIRGHTNWVMTCIVFAPNFADMPTAQGTRALLSCSSDGSVRVWNISDEQLTSKTITTPKLVLLDDAVAMGGGARKDDTVWAMDCCLVKRGGKDYDLAVSAHTDYCLRLWHLTADPKKQLICRLPGHTNWAVGCTYFMKEDCPDGFTVLSCSDDCSLKLWDIQADTLACVEVSHGENRDVRAVSTLHGHSALVVACESFCSEHANTSKRFHDRALSCSSDKQIRLWNLKTCTCIRTLDNAVEARGCCVGWESKWKVTAITACNQPILRVWDLTRVLEHTSSPSSIDKQKFDTPAIEISKSQIMMNTYVVVGRTAQLCCAKCFGSKCFGSKCETTAPCTELHAGTEVRIESTQRADQEGWVRFHSVVYGDNLEQEGAWIKKSSLKQIADAEAVSSCHRFYVVNCLRPELDRKRSELRVYRWNAAKKTRGVELALYGRTPIEHTGVVSLDILQPSFDTGMLMVQVTTQNGKCMHYDLSKVFASQTLRGTLTEQKFDIGLDDDYNVSPLMTWHSAALEALQIAEQIVAARAAQFTELGKSSEREKWLKDKTLPNNTFKQCKYGGGGNSRGWRSQAIKEIIGIFSSREKDEHTLVFTMATIVLVLSIKKHRSARATFRVNGVTASTNAQPTHIRGDQTNSKMLCLLNQARDKQSWLANQIKIGRTPSQDSAVSSWLKITGRQRGEVPELWIDQAFHGHQKLLVKYFLDAFIVMQQETRCCRTELNEVLNSGDVANLLALFPKLTVSFLEFLPLRKVHQEPNELLWVTWRGSSELIVQESMPLGTSQRNEKAHHSGTQGYWHVSIAGHVGEKHQGPATRHLVPLVATGCNRLEDINLLKEVVAATTVDNPRMFSGEVIPAIVRYQWFVWARDRYMAVFFEHVCFISMFAAVTLCNSILIRHTPMAEQLTQLFGLSAPDSAGSTIELIVSPVLWLLCIFHAISMLRWRKLWISADFSTVGTYYSVLDVLNILLVPTSLVSMLLDQDNERYHATDTLHAMTSLTNGLALLYLMRGIHRFSFLMNMLENIVIDMIPFALVLVVILIT